MIIYKVTNKINGKEYVGQTTISLKKRKGGHINAALSTHDNNYFHSALRKYGPENFDWKTIHGCVNIDDLNKWEIYYIKYYNTFNNGYNLTLGGFGSIGYKHTEETKKKISIANGGKKSIWYGKKHSEESKRKMSESHKGIKPSDETKRKLSKAFKGEKNHFYGKHHSEKMKRKMSELQSGEKHPFYGRHHSDETKRKMSETKKGKNHPMYGKHLSEEHSGKISEGLKGKNNPRARAVIIGDKFFDTREQAAKFVNISASHVRYRILHATKWLDYSYA